MAVLKTNFRALFLLAVALGSAPAFAADWQEYQARYAVYRNGKLAGKTEFTFEQAGEQWIIRSEGRGTHGMARLLRARDLEFTEGRIRAGRFWPDSFSRHSTVAGIDKSWTASFDWDSRSVQTVAGRERRQLDLGEDGALDGLSLKLELQRRLRAGENDLVFHLVDDDEIKHQEFRRQEPERLETSLGCLDTIPVERLRTGSKRYTRAWHAPEFGFVTVRMEHGKTGGDHMEMRITELVLNGQAVAPKAGCAALQGSP
jgi:hypothetical protein